jgi:release factor glutamine methyltransferase
MRPSEVVSRAATYLERHGVDAPRQTAEVLLEMVLGVDRASLYTRTEGLSTNEARMFGRALCQRCSGTPLQHLTGSQGFRRISVQVRPGVFVPRPETEVLVGAALDALARVEHPAVVDVGTGTGAIALAIADERPEARVFATDLSPEAVDLARANAARLHLPVTVWLGDLFEPLPLRLVKGVDLVASNPPYVTEDEYDDLPVEVRAEPRLALVGGIEWVERLAREATRWLRDGGVLALEIGDAQGPEIARILGRSYRDVRILPDLVGRDRVVLGVVE